MQCVSKMLKIYPEYKMQNSSPDPVGSSILYNDSGYFTNHNPDPQSSNSEPSFEVVEEISLHKQGECLPLQSTSGVYFCEDAVFDEPKLEGPPLLCDNTNNYEQFSSLIKFSLEETSESYLNNDQNLRLTSFQDSSNSEYHDRHSTSVLQYFDQDSLSSLSSINPSQPISVTDNRQSIISQAVEQCLTISASQTSTQSASQTSFQTSIQSASQISFQTKSDIDIKVPIRQNEHLDNNAQFDNSNAGKQTCTPTKTYINPINPDASPELFSDEGEPVSEIETSLNISQQHTSPNENFLKNDRKLLKRIQETLSGVPPPPSVTILQLSVSEMLEKIYSNKHLFLSANDIACKSNENKNSACAKKGEKKVKSLLISNTKEEVDRSTWPGIINCRYHGLYFNRSVLSEDIESSCLRYLSRYVGCETASLRWGAAAPGSATKRRNARLRWAARSPGRRLSHLARRRITFSSASLQHGSSAGGAGLSVIGNSAGSARQIMIDPRKNNKRKSPRKSPWKKSPQKRIKTPNSSAKKRSARRFNMGGDDDPKPGSSKMTISSTKRALFQSPDHTLRSTISSSSSTSSSASQSRRALFQSPGKRSPAKVLKRKRCEEDIGGNSKFPRSLSFDVHHERLASEAGGSGGAGLQRRNSEVLVRKGELSELHKQKMLWAVSEALRSHQISMSHPQFRMYASILCKVIKQLVPDLMSRGPRQPGSTSDRMLRIARQHSYAVTRGKSLDDIMQQIKESNSTKIVKPAGYVPPDKTQKNVLQDKVMNIDTSRVVSEMKPEVVSDNKLKSIRRQIVFDDTEITKCCNTNR